MAVQAGDKPNEFIVNGRKYRVEYARLVLAREVLKSTISKIIIPDVAQRKYAPTKGVLVASGETASEEWKDNIGCEVIFARFAGDWVKLDEKDPEEDSVFICQDEDVLITRVE